MKLNILCLEPFYGGSHKSFLDGLIENSAHDYTLYTLPSRYWKWRMRGASLHFYNEVNDPENYDLLLTCGLLSLADLKALWGGRCPPTAVYLHETQLSYPLQEGEKMDYQFGFTDITTGLTADRLIFNSRFHMEKFLTDLPPFIRRMPEFKPHWAVDLIRTKSTVLYPGCTLPAFPRPAAHTEGAEGLEGGTSAPHTAGSVNPVKKEETPLKAPQHADRIPLIIWNHRWEYDKDPAAFFAALYALDDRGYHFNLALLGENYQKVPKEFLQAREHFGERVLRYGWCESRGEYESWLDRGDFILSTSIQENYGISVIEAVARGCFPLLPERLSYPELLPEEFRERCLYKPAGTESTSGKEAARRGAPLADRLAILLDRWYPDGGESLSEEATTLRRYYNRYSWGRLIGRYDKLFEEVYMAGNLNR